MRKSDRRVIFLRLYIYYINIKYANDEISNHPVSEFLLYHCINLLMGGIFLLNTVTFNPTTIESRDLSRSNVESEEMEIRLLLVWWCEKNNYMRLHHENTPI